MKAIAMIDKNWALNDKSGSQPVHLTNDLKRFKEFTTGETVIMGRNTFFELDGPLPNRKNIIISTTLNYEDYDTPVISNIDELLSFHMTYEAGLHSWVIGGGQLYAQLLPYCTNLYLTRVETEFDEPTVFFPNIYKDFNRRFLLTNRRYSKDTDRITGTQYWTAFEEYVNLHVGG